MLIMKNKQKIGKTKSFFYSIKLIFSQCPIMFFFYVLIIFTLAIYPLIAINFEALFIAEISNNLNIGWKGESVNSVISLLITYLIIQFSVYMLYKILAYFEIYMISKIKKNLHLKIMDHNDKINYELFENKKHYDKMKLACQEASKVNVLHIHLNIVRCISMIFSLVSLSLVLFKFSIFCLIIAIVASIPGFIHQSWFGKKNWEFNNKEITNVRKMNYLFDNLTAQNAMKETKIYNLKPLYMLKYNNLYNNHLENIRKFNKKNLLLGIIFSSLHAVGTSSIIIYFYYSGLMRIIDIATAVLYVGAATSIYNCIQNIIYYYGNYKNSLKSNTNLIDFLEYDIDKNIVSDIEIKRIEKIEFKNVTFKYPNSEKYIFENLNLIINANYKYAIVGENGVGKTTLIKLMMGLYRPTSGEIFINDIKIEKISRKSLSLLFGCCFQDYYLYSMSIEKNINIGSIDINDEEELLKSISLVQLDDVINYRNLKRSYSKLFDSEGIVLSGGQQQKLALARTFFSNKQLIILDEPSASLDVVSEHQIFENIYNKISNKTVLFITHRLSNVIKSDYIILLRNARVEEIDKHDSLINNNKYYKELFNKQAENYKIN